MQFVSDSLKNIVLFEAFVSLRMIKKPFSYVVLVFSRAQLVQALHGFYWGFNVFVKRGVLFFPAKMSRKLSLPTELKPDLGKPWLCVHATQRLNVESISTLSETGGSTCSLALKISCQLAKDYGGIQNSRTFKSLYWVPEIETWVMKYSLSEKVNLKLIFLCIDL